VRVASTEKNTHYVLGLFDWLFVGINKQRTDIDQMKPNLAQARRACSSLLDPADDTPVSNWIWVVKSIPRSVGIARPEHQVLVCANAERVVTCGKIDSCSVPVSARSRECCGDPCSRSPFCDMCSTISGAYALKVLLLLSNYFGWTSGTTQKLELPDGCISTETPQANRLLPGSPLPVALTPCGTSCPLR